MKITEKQRLKIRAIESEKTYREVMQLIRTKDIGKCMVIRPTGFGKSYMLARVTSESTIINNGGTALYVYPYETIKSDVERKYGVNGTSNVRFQNTSYITYKMFTQLGTRNKGNPLIKYLNQKNVRIILLDEVHLAGAKGFKQAYENIKHKIGSGQGKIRLIGVTATPYRMDGFDILNEIFDGHKVSDYTMDDCISDGLMKKPIYKNSLQTEDLINDLVKEYNNRYIKINTELLISNAKEVIRTQDRIELNEMLNPSECIRNTVCRTLNQPKPKYLKFIVFFPTIKSMDTLEFKVTDYFNGAFPYLKTNITRVSSAADSDDVEDLHDLNERAGVIDLIFCVNKINMGYHVDDINGIMMLRGTRSDIIYKQQIGRCMSVTSKIAPIVFDMINNVSKKPYYSVDIDDFNGVEEDESDGQLKDKQDKIESELNMDSLEIDRDTHEYTEILEELLLELNKRIENNVAWLYEDRHALMYILADKYANGTRKNITDILSSKQIKIEDETELRNRIPKEFSRRLVNTGERRMG